MNNTKTSSNSTNSNTRATFGASGRSASDSVFPRPNAIIYNIIAFLMRIYLRLTLHPTYNTDELRRIDGPAVILCTHTSNLDFLLVAVGLLPLRPTYIMSNHFFAHPKIGKLLAPLHAIPKKMFCADVNAIRQIMKARRAGNAIIMFPEGRLSCCGHTVQIADGTAELVKKLGVDVYSVTLNGVYKAMPKWGKAGLRRGPVSIDGSKLLDAEELKSLSVAEIEAAIAGAIKHDDEQSFIGAAYKCKAPALGLEGILYKCPCCGEEFTMATNSHTLSCTGCGAAWTLDEKYILNRSSCNNSCYAAHEKSSHPDHSASGADGTYTFHSINAWFDWEQSLIDLDAGLETACTLATPDEAGVTDRSAGHGHITINREEIRFVGECHGKPLDFTEKTSLVKAFPATVGDHFDIYSDRVMYNIIPQPNPAEAIKWVQYLDKLSAESRF